jgi:hypothetical protein
MKNRKKLLVLIVILLGMIESCVNPALPLRRIRQSNKMYEDNVNGRVYRNVEESTNFLYNADGTLGRVTVYDDTTISANLLKDYSIEYQSNRVVINTYDIAYGYKKLYFYFNDKKQLTDLRDTIGNGIRFSYTDDRITDILDSSSTGYLHYINFVYDINNNLTSYDLLNLSGNPTIRAVLEYNSDPITDELDTRLFQKYANYIYIGGLNLVSKLGLNMGISNTNTLIHRTELRLIVGDTGDVYKFGYIYNADREIIKRNFQYKDDTLFYQFKYE